MFSVYCKKYIKFTVMFYNNREYHTFNQLIVDNFD